MVVCIVLIGMYICCNVLNYSINSYDARDVHIVSKDRKTVTFLMKEKGGCGKACLSVIIFHYSVKLIYSTV